MKVETTLCAILVVFTIGEALPAQVQEQTPTSQTPNPLNAVAVEGNDHEIDFSLPGLSKQKPKGEYYVEIDGGYMVPYLAKIPGTNVFFKMMPIPGGTFNMGSPNSEEYRRDDECPQVEISIEPFWMGKYEVTWSEYRLFMKLAKEFKELRRQKVRNVTKENRLDAVTAPSAVYDPDYLYSAGGEARQPCAMMSQFAAKQYTKYISLLLKNFYRLPTEAEWEYACRAGTTTAYYFGDDQAELKNHAWFYNNSDDWRHPVGRLKPNPWGLHDMYGNVAEWVLDEYDEKAYQRLIDKKSTALEAYNAPSEIHPRVCRGGSFELDAIDCRSAARIKSVDDWQDDDPNLPRSPWWFTSSTAMGVGFRVMRPLHAPQDRTQQERFWKANAEATLEAVDSHVEESGRGAIGIVDEGLIEAIRKNEGK